MNYKRKNSQRTRRTKILLPRKLFLIQVSFAYNERILYARGKFFVTVNYYQTIGIRASPANSPSPFKPHSRRRASRPRARARRRGHRVARVRRVPGIRPRIQGGGGARYRWHDGVFSRATHRLGRPWRGCWKCPRRRAAAAACSRARGPSGCAGPATTSPPPRRAPACPSRTCTGRREGEWFSPEVGDGSAWRVYRWWVSRGFAIFAIFVLLTLCPRI